PEVPELVTVATHQKVGEAIDLMQRYGISQIPVIRNGDQAASLADVVGSIRESGLLDRVFKNQDALSEDVAAAMEPPLPAVEIGAVVRSALAEASPRARTCSSTLLISKARSDGATRQPDHPRRLGSRPGAGLLRGPRVEDG